MHYVFEDFELDAARVELRRGEAVVPVEPRVFALLLLLVENRDRMVSKDEIIEKIWDGRIVSDDAISTCIRSARRVLGDDGKSQRYIRTVHSRGLRFVASAYAAPAVAAHPAGPPPADPRPGSAVAATIRPPIAIRPFCSIGSSDPGSAIGEAVAHDLLETAVEAAMAVRDRARLFVSCEPGRERRLRLSFGRRLLPDRRGKRMDKMT